jgi:hypothetical protein
MSVLERVPLEQISERASTIDPLSLLLRLLAAPLLALGFAVAMLWAAMTWMCAAVLVGFERGRQVADASRAPQRGTG